MSTELLPMLDHTSKAYTTSGEKCLQVLTGGYVSTEGVPASGGVVVEGLRQGDDGAHARLLQRAAQERGERERRAGGGGDAARDARQDQI